MSSLDLCPHLSHPSALGLPCPQTLGPPVAHLRILPHLLLAEGLELPQDSATGLELPQDSAAGSPGPPVPVVAWIPAPAEASPLLWGLFPPKCSQFFFLRFSF